MKKDVPPKFVKLLFALAVDSPPDPTSTVYVCPGVTEMLFLQPRPPPPPPPELHVEPPPPPPPTATTLTDVTPLGAIHE
jgi:hypothetical protein